MTHWQSDRVTEVRLAALWVAVHRINSIKGLNGTAKTRREVARLVSDQSTVIRNHFSKSSRRAMRACIHGSKLSFSPGRIVSEAAYGIGRGHSW